MPKSFLSILVVASKETRRCPISFSDPKNSVSNFTGLVTPCMVTDPSTRPLVVAFFNSLLKTQHLLHDEDVHSVSHGLLIEDKSFIDRAAAAVGFFRPFVLEREGMLLDAPHGLVQVFHDLLRPHDPDHLGGGKN